MEGDLCIENRNLQHRLTQKTLQRLIQAPQRNHTGVRPAYGGQGIARRLVEKVIEEARARQIKILPLCSYASKMMEGKTEYQDVLVIR